jgi:2-polyprenyl-6-methoxyphenol hydroxylase-like FAD-dependent oxidoreductase
MNQGGVAREFGSDGAQAQKTTRPYARAVIMGGNLGGMAAARVLSDFFDDVIILERDVYPEGYEHRKGVPQSKHPHFLLGAGLDALKQLFPSFADRMQANGAFFERPGLTTANLEGTGWSPQSESPMRMLYASRLVVDPTVRSFVREIENVTILEGVSVEGLLWNEDHTRVTGVRASDRPSGASRMFHADLVVDACGRASRLLRWFKEAGLPPVPRMTLDAKCAYSTVWLEKPEKVPDHIWWNSMAVQPVAGDVPLEHQFLGVILPTERNRWIATMGSWNGYESMPTDFESYLAVAKKMRTPWFAEAISRCAPISDVYMTKATANFWNRFDWWEKSIGGIVAVGDANQAFNPFYGQGMSCCARGCLILQEVLRTTSIYDATFHRGFARKLNEYLEVPWALASGRDSIVEKAEGTEVCPDGIARRLTRRYALTMFDVVTRASRVDERVAVQFDKLINIKIGLNEFRRNPEILLRIGWSELRHRLRIVDQRPADASLPPPRRVSA